MIDRAEITARVEKVYEDRRLENMKLKDKRLEEVTAAVPDFAKIEKEIAGNGFRLVSLAASGSKDKPAYSETENKLAELAEERAALLRAGGCPEDYLDGCYTCKKCRDTGRVTDGNGMPFYCDCYKEYCKELILKESGLPVKKGFEVFDPGIFAEEDRPEAMKLLENAKAFVDGFDTERNRLFFGKAGVGKTFLASITATELIRKGVYAVYTTVPMLMQTLLYFGEDESLQEKRDKMHGIVHSADLLILDELGTERMTPARQDFLETIIDGIGIEPKRKCIVISNLDTREMLSAYGERMFSRLASMNLVKFDLPATGDLRVRF